MVGGIFPHHVHLFKCKGRVEDRFNLAWDFLGILDRGEEKQRVENVLFMDTAT